MNVPDVAINNILFTTDFVEDACHVYAYAKRVAEQFNARLTLLHVVEDEPLDLLVFDVGIDRAPGVQQRLASKKDQMATARKAVVEKVKADFGEAAFQPENIVVEKGNPVKTILKVAEQRECDMIVMGFKGRSTLEDVMMGDTVRRVLHRSTVPVLIVHPTKNT